MDRGEKGRNRKLSSRSIDWDHLQTFSWNRLRAVVGEIAGICPRRAWGRRQAPPEGPRRDRRKPIAFAPASKPLPSPPLSRHWPYRDAARAIALAESFNVLDGSAYETGAAQLRAAALALLLGYQTLTYQPVRTTRPVPRSFGLPALQYCEGY